MIATPRTNLLPLAEASGLVLFTSIVTGFVLYNFRGLFFPRHARLHRWMGVIYFSLLVVGAIDASRGLLGKDTMLAKQYDTALGVSSRLDLVFDSMLGIAGVLIAVTAALDFGPAHDEARFVHNKASGTLDEHATVTKGEMWEHSFYQFLLLAQILFIHGMGALTRAYPDALELRLLGLALVTLPWYFRSRFPVNPFSKNYKDEESAWTVIGVMYRIKKYQYVFLKHVLIHGLNISLAIHGHPNLAQDPVFRFFWILVNFSYTMEFFLQTLVKKKKMEQQTMLNLQKFLMGLGSLGSVAAIRNVHPVAAVVSCFMNFNNRGYELVNTSVAAAAALLSVAMGY